jgi:hypothetical protein
MPVSIDTKKAFLHRTHGDITVIFTWVNDERAMVLLPHRRAGAPWYIVMDSAAYTWDDSNRKSVEVVARKAFKACEVLGIEPSPTNCRRIAGIIIDGLPDLIRMPSAPSTEYYNTSMGSMTLRANGQTVAQQDIRLEKEGVSYG